MVIKKLVDAGLVARKAAAAAAKGTKAEATQGASQTAAKPAAKIFAPKTVGQPAKYAPRPNVFDEATKQQFLSRLEALGSTPVADELSLVLAQLPRLGREALAEPLARAAERGLAHRLSAAARLGDDVDRLSASADDAGKYVTLLREVGAPDVLGQVRGTEDLLQQVASLRHGQLKALAQGGRQANAPAALKQVESLASDLMADLQRVARHGFAPPKVDVKALKEAAERAVLGLPASK